MHTCPLPLSQFGSWTRPLTWKPWSTSMMLATVAPLLVTEST
jgi:hypothetical protein